MTEDNENSAIEWNKRGVMLAKKDKPKEALIYFDQALKLDPFFASAWCNKGNVLANEGKLADALACIKRSITLDPENPEAFFIKGRILYLEKGWLTEEALGCLKKAIELYKKENDKYGEALLAQWLERIDKESRVAFRRRLLK